MKVAIPPSAKNWLSLTGVLIALAALFMIVFLIIAATFVRMQTAYLGLITYILLPSVMIAGLFLIPVGMYLAARRERQGKGRPVPRWPKIDLEDARHRHGFFIFVIGTGFFLLISAIGSYEAFHYTESLAFCGTLCHRVMEPEHVAHKNSPHAKVACVACHVGPGADWYVRSKLSGLYQVYAVLTNAYPRPIPTPIKDLRPARAVCEQCHWPQQFYGQKLELRTHYLQDKQNSPWQIGLSLKTGPAEAAKGLIEGIHWHINPRVRIEYRAMDPGRQKIPWVRYTDLDSGIVRIFRDKNQAPSGQVQQQSDFRVMDCIDCHNRPSHRYRPPSEFIDTAITAGRIPATLPEIKKLAVQLCAAEYPTADAARDAIRKGLTQFYQKNYPALWDKQQELVEKSIRGVQQEFGRNVFPHMKVQWKAYPDNIGHVNFAGCFRCHTGNHADQQGKTISKDCSLCHDITVQGIEGRGLEAAKTGETLNFRHPEDNGAGLAGNRLRRMPWSMSYPAYGVRLLRPLLACRLGIRHDNRMITPTRQSLNVNHGG